MAAKLGNAKAMRNLAYLYYFGKGVRGDPARARALFAAAAEAGLDKAKYNLGYLYYRGEGVPRNLSIAAYHFGQAAEAGNADAQLMLSRIYILGDGVKQDPAKAFFWALLGAVQKPDLAEWHFDKLRGQLKIGQMDRIRAQSKAWDPDG